MSSPKSRPPKSRAPASSQPVYLSADDILDRLERPRRRRDGSGGVACCPAHEDRNPSLDVRDGDRGTVLTCRAGCTFKEIVAALGLEPEQLFREPRHRRPYRSRSPAPPPDPNRDALRDLLAWNARRRPPSRERMRDELVLVGKLLLGGTAELRQLPPEFNPSWLESTPLRHILMAVFDLARQGTPRRWFSPFALVREVPHLTHAAWARDPRNVYFWCRLAVGTARRCP